MKDIWFKREDKAKGLMHVTQGERGYTIYWGGRSSADALYVGTVYRLKQNPYRPMPADRVDKVEWGFTNVNKRYCRSTRVFDTMEGAMESAKRFLEAHTEMFLASEGGA